MPDFRILDIVLLSCNFEVWPSLADKPEEAESAPEPKETEEPEQPEEPKETEQVAETDTTAEKPDNNHTEDELFDYPAGEFLRLEPNIWEDNDHYYLALDASIDDPSFPFRLNLMIGTRFFVGREEDGSRPTIEEAASTLVWLTYPYLREMIATLSMRSPLPAYHLPAITKLPHPSVTEGG